MSRTQTTFHFTKMHGIGNDYVYVNGFQEKIVQPEKVSRFISDRHTGVGSDGLILILPSERADFRMRMFNADGSEGKMCGNGARCVGKYVYDYGLTQKTSITLETLAGIRQLCLTVNPSDKKVSSVSVDMGRAVLKPSDIPVLAPPEQKSLVNQPLAIENHTYMITCVSMGNPHCIVFQKEDVALLNLEQLGPLFERHILFPDRMNTEFVNLISPVELSMRVWERGSGETFACGTGACAVAVAAVENGYSPANTPLTIHLRGGDLQVIYHEDGTVRMEGPASTVFDGVITVCLS